MGPSRQSAEDHYRKGGYDCSGLKGGRLEIPQLQHKQDDCRTPEAPGQEKQAVSLGAALLSLSRMLFCKLALLSHAAMRTCDVGTTCCLSNALAKVTGNRRLAFNRRLLMACTV